MAVEIYTGTYVNAEEANKYIDIATIAHCCRLLKDASLRLESTSKKIINARDYCTREALFMQGETVEEPIEFCGKDFNDISSYMNDFADAILEATNRAYDKKQLELNEEARILDAQEALKNETVGQ